jgi:dTDP-4-amino-4,6-dideoxygalactose transaminase
VLLAQFERLPEQIALRTANAERLKHALADVPEIVWQDQPASVTQSPYYLLLGKIGGGSRDAFCQALSAAGVPCTPFYPHPLYENPAYQEAVCRIMPCPVAENRVRDSFWLPHRVLLADDETIEEVAEAIRRAAKAKGPPLNKSPQRFEEFLAEGSPSLAEPIR